MGGEKTNYTMGYSQPTVSTHAARTIFTDAAFVLPHIKETDRILDIGCGPGSITLGFSTLVPEGEVVGVDVSHDVVELAQAKAAESDYDTTNVSFKVGDVVKGLDFIPDDSFDVVFASQVFPHLPTADMRARAVVEMRRVLRPGGVLATRTVAEIHWYPRSLGMDELFDKNMIRGLGADDFAGASMPGAYRAAGFDNITVGAGTNVWASAEERFAHADNYLERLKEGDPFKQSWLDSGLTETDIEATREALKKWADTDDAWYVAVQAEVLGWK